MKAEKFISMKAIFLTREFALATKTRLDAASRKLKSLEKSELIQFVTRGLWANTNHPNYSVYSLTPYLVGAEQGYVSFLSALQRHQVISQIPQRIFVATTGHGRKLNSKGAAFEFIQMNPKYMQSGIQWLNQDVTYGLATAEKALIDCLYISSRRGRKFKDFPELDLSNINQAQFLKLLKQHEFPKRIENHIRQRFKELLSLSV
jgi:predicted transcriptional regulator of viral defense system